MGTAYSHGAAARSAGVSDVIAQRMNGSVTCVPPAPISGIDTSIASTPTTPLAIAFARSVRNSASCSSSRAACSSNAVRSSVGSSAP